MKRVNLEDNYEEHLEANVEQLRPPVSKDELTTFEVSQVGKLIHQVREKEHMTVEELAEKCGTSAEFISDIENNKKEVDLLELSRIVRQGLNGQLELIMRF